ncbi:MAG: hypothetical protein OXG65_05780 [Chloroflexi bacterium]|nr:hypothetical protein [Chloroflexota bacterium]
MRHFSERELGAFPREKTEVSRTVWDGLAQLVDSLVDDGSLGAGFPDYCRDSGSVCCGTNRHKFEVAIAAVIPELVDGAWMRGWGITAIEQPPIYAIMDVLEFVWQNVGQPVLGRRHEYYEHYHFLQFDVKDGQERFRENVNSILNRNRLAFTMTSDGKMKRLLPIEFSSVLRRSAFVTGDSELDNMIETARRKFLQPDEGERREAVEKLWDAWERVKTVQHSDKRIGAKMILDTAANSCVSEFRQLLEAEALTLTNAGNKFRIRHSETSQEQLQSPEHVDYLFLRMFSLLNLILTSLFPKQTSGKVNKAPDKSLF